MITQYATKEKNGFDWIDINNPVNNELQKIAQQYQLHQALVEDCLQPSHLPKFEKMNNYAFIIFRIFTDEAGPEADTVQELTDKMAIFYSQDFIITVHKKDKGFILPIGTDAGTNRFLSSEHLLNHLLRVCILTYEKPANEMARMVDVYEEHVFMLRKKVPILKGMYYLRRQVDFVQRVFILSQDIVDSIDHTSTVDTRETRDLFIRLKSMYTNLSENINQLLNVYFSISSQRTNEIMRVLTIISVFFMPLTFIAGVYGMNFRFMPELEWHLGYPGVMLFMLAITLGIYLWLKRKGWL